MQLPPEQLRLCAFTIVLTLVSAGGIAAQAPEESADSQLSEDEAPAHEAPLSASVDCAASHMANFSGRLYLACGRRLIVLEPSVPRRLADRTFDETIRGFHESEGALWVELEGGQGMRVAVQERPATTVMAPMPAANLGDERARGHILSVDDDLLTVDIGRSDGVEIGDRIDVSSREPEQWDASDGAVIGVVDAVQEHRARVRIRWGETVDPSAPAIETPSERTGSLAAPPLPRGFRIEAELLGATPIDDLGALLAVQGRIEYRARRYLLARLRLLPSGFSVGKGPDYGTSGLSAEVGFDQRYVGASLGVGLQRSWDRMDEEWRPLVVLPTTFRIGAVDGVMVEFTTSLTVLDQKLEFLSASGRIQTPLRSGLWLGARGFGGSGPAFWNGEAYVRVALRGNGLPGSTMLDLGVGALGTTNRSPESRFGPSLSVGVVQLL